MDADVTLNQALGARYLTTADVARRLGVAGGTVRHYGERLRGRGYPFAQGENGEWLWPPEVVEVARAAYTLAKVVRGVAFEDALDYLEYAGRLAVEAGRQETLTALSRRLLALPDALREVPHEVGVELRRVAAEAAQELRAGIREAVMAAQAPTRELRETAQSLQGWASHLTTGIWWMGVLPTLALLVVSLVVVVKEGSTPFWLGAIGIGVVGFLLGRLWSGE